MMYDRALIWHSTQHQTEAENGKSGGTQGCGAAVGLACSLKADARTLTKHGACGQKGKRDAELAKVKGETTREWLLLQKERLHSRRSVSDATPGGAAGALSRKQQEAATRAHTQKRHPRTIQLYNETASR
jgi:hypothetical protein